jgi:formylglycine-generating enzyme required for sulfatase activity
MEPTRVRPGGPGDGGDDGETLARLGPYRILDEVGRGGMGVVYRARRDDLEAEFALKVILPGDAGDPESAARFRREAKAAARLGAHPGIVGVHDFGESEGRLWFAMDLIEGHGLDRAIDEELTLPPRRAAQVVAQAARAMHFAHANGVMHRDLKPGNLILDGEGNVLVTDFGLVKSLKAGPELTRLTQANYLVGTPAYMAPEQARGLTLDARADVYALGATLFECLTGAPPFAADTALEMVRQVTDTEPVPPSRRNATVPAELDVITLRCLEKDPERRYPTAEALAADLERWLAGEPITARAAGGVERLLRRIARNPAAWGVPAAVILIASVVSTVLGVQAWQARASHLATINAFMHSGHAHRGLHDALLREVGELERVFNGMRKDGTEGEPRRKQLDLLNAKRRELDAAYAAAQAGYKGALEFAAADSARESAAADALAGLALARLRHAEAFGHRADARRFEGELAEFAAVVPGPAEQPYAEVLRGAGTLSLDTVPSGATVELLRYVDAAENGYLEPAHGEVLGETPLEQVPVPRGSYLLILRKAGFADVRYPVLIERNEAERPKAPVPLLRPEEIGDGYVYVPAGESWLGSNRLGVNAAPREAVWVGGFCVAVHEVTVAQYRAFLDAQLQQRGERRLLEDPGRPDRGAAHRRELAAGVAGHQRELERRHGVLQMAVGGRRARDHAADLPGVGAGRPRRRRTAPSLGRGLRLGMGAHRQAPGASRGRRAEPQAGRDRRPRCLPVRGARHGRQPDGDVSPFGVHDMAGSQTEWCLDPPVAWPNLRWKYGGTWAGLNADTIDMAVRAASLPRNVGAPTGFRVRAEPKRR